jgi:hypothetical protein
MKKVLLIVVLSVLSIGTYAQDKATIKESVKILQKYLDGVEDNAKIVVSDEGIITYTKKFSGSDNDYRAVFRLSNVKISLEEVADKNYIEGEPKYYMKFSCTSKDEPCIVYTKLSDESSTNSYKFTNFPVWTKENGEDAVAKLQKLQEMF